MTRTLRVGAALAVLLLGAAAAVVLWSGVRSLDAPLRLTAPMRFKVAPGVSFAHVATELATQGIVAQPRAWILYARWKGMAPAVKATPSRKSRRVTVRMATSIVGKRSGELLSSRIPRFGQRG